MIIDVSIAASERYKVRKAGKRGLSIGLPKVYVDDVGIESTAAMDIRRVGTNGLLLTPEGQDVSDIGVAALLAVIGELPSKGGAK